MRLLVSVRSAAEAGIALAGGADIIDAKEPSVGSLGPVSPEVLAEIFQRVPERCPVSVALGDVASVNEVLERVSAIPIRRATYLKLGFAGVVDPEILRRLLATARAAAARPVPRNIVAVAYADGVLAGSPAPHAVCQAAAEAGAAGILLDTYSKRDGNLLSWIPLGPLTELLARARASGLLTAVAGRLGAGHLDTVRSAGAEVVGFRGALCAGGREGCLSPRRVRLIRQRLTRLDSGFLQAAV